MKAFYGFLKNVLDRNYNLPVDKGIHLRVYGDLIVLSNKFFTKSWIISSTGYHKKTVENPFANPASFMKFKTELKSGYVDSISNFAPSQPDPDLLSFLQSIGFVQVGDNTSGEMGKSKV